MEGVRPIEIKRNRGRIAGFGRPRVPCEVLWCGTNRPRKKFGRRQNGWSFPPAVRELLIQSVLGQTVLHLFGGRADFGVRLDIDPSTKPHVVGDAWLPPFARDSFDVVILDPPYVRIQQQEKIALLRAAAWIARRRVYWFHTIWIATDRSLPLLRSWLIRVGDQCAVRCLQEFGIREPKLPPLEKFTRGPAIRYNRWFRDDQQLLPLAPAPQLLREASPTLSKSYPTDEVSTACAEMES